MHLRRARVQHAPEDSLDWTPPWTLALLDHMIETRGATIAITGEAEPELLADLDQRRAQRTRARLGRGEAARRENRRLIQWTIVGYPNEGWATAVFGEPDVERLWDAVDRRDAPRRARPGRRVADAHRPARASGRRCSTSAASTPSTSAARAPTSSSA